MNATDQAKTPEVAARIASLVSLFREAFPDAVPDLSPWLTDDATQALIDPHSIDVSFQFPGVHPTCRGHCVLMQIHYTERPHIPDASAIGIEASGYCYHTQQWRLTTIGAWQFEGQTLPTSEAQQQLRQVFRGMFQLLKHPICSSPAS